MINDVMYRFKKVNVWGFLKNNSAFASVALLFIFASIRYKDSFFTYSYIGNLFRQVSMIGLVAIGMTFVILAGAIDLSVGSTVAVAAVTTAYFSNINIFLALTVPIVLGVIIGIINGFIVSKLEIPPFIATLAMMMCLRGLIYIFTGISTVSVNDNAIPILFMGRGYILSYIPFPALIFIAVTIIVIFVSKMTSFGRNVYAVGGNEEASIMMGLNANRTKIICYMINGGLAALAGIILAGRLGAGQPVSGEGWEMDAIAATAIGGALLTGGVGNFSGTFFGVLIIGLINSIINLQGNLNSYWQKIIMGGLLLFVIMLQYFTGRKKINKI